MFSNSIFTKRIKAFMVLALAGALLLGGALDAAFVNAAGTQEPEKNHNGGGYAATGQIPNMGYMAVLYDATNLLPTSDANCVIGTSYGYVWIGSYSGVFRYDGTNLEKMPAELGVPNGRGMFEDSRKYLWVATNDSGIGVIGDGNVYNFTKKEGLPSSSVRCFAEDGNGFIYIGTTAGVAYVDRGMKLHKVDDERLNSERVLRLVSDAEGRIYGQTKRGCIFSLDRDRVLSFYESGELGIDKITTILADPEKPETLYLGTSEDCIYYGKYGDSAEKMQRIHTGPAANIHWISYDCNRIWVSSETVIGYLDKGRKFNLVENLPMNDSIEMQASDYQGNMWFASSRQGVMKIIANNFVNCTGQAGITDEVVNTTCLRGKDLYVGTDNGLKVVGTDKKPVENQLTSYIGSARVRCLTLDKKGNLWVSTFSEDLGLVCMDASGNIRNFTKEDGLPNNEIRCTSTASDGSLLVGTNYGIAVIKNGTVVRSISGDEGMKNAVILSICEGKDGKLYVGSDGGGLYVIDKDNSIETLDEEQGLTSDVILRIKKDPTRDIYWILTSNSMEYMKGSQIQEVNTFPDNNNLDIFFDSKGDPWVLSGRGLYHVAAEDALENKITSYRLYTLASGLTSLPVSNSFSHLDGKGNLYIAGHTGVSRVNIENFFEESSSLLIEMGTFVCDGKQIFEEEGRKYTIPAGTGRIQITPSILDYTVSDPLVRVYLEGAEDAGITASRSQLSALEYTGLAYGNYTLHVQILDRKNGAVVSDETFSIYKQPKFFEMTAVRLLLMALVILAAGIIVWRVMTFTVIRKQYDQIREAKDEADRANSAKSRFLANMSHEIRTPINTILGMDEMILREDSTDVPKGYFSSVVNYALDIRRASESLLGLINDVLDISKIESGKMNIVEQEYSPEDMLRAAITMIRVRSDAKNLFFHVDIDSRLPKKLYGDEGKIKQIILNLLTNAVKYTDSGGFTLKVAVEEKDRLSCRLRFSVKDTGIGVRAEDLDKLFNAYERLDEKKNSGIQGTGLGLDISRQFAELMQGRLWCESVYGQGSEFILTLSQKIADETEIGVFREENSLPKGPYVPQFVAPDADILVVDDNPMNLTVIKGLLRPTKVFVTTAESGEDCLDKLRLNRFNVVLLDHMMPGMDGIETLEKIRQLYPELPVYALTANIAAGGDEFYKSKGFNGYLSKPIDSYALEKAIMKHLPEEILMKPEGEAAAYDREDENLLAWLRQVEGISVSEGIKASGGTDTFLKAAQMFADNLEDNAESIETAYVNSDLKLYTIKVHALKSSARIVGAMKLSADCQNLENAGNAQDWDFIREHHGEMMNLYRSYDEKLERLRTDSGEESGSGENGDDPRENMADEELSEAFASMRDFVSQMDYDSMEMVLNMLGDYKLSSSGREKVTKIKKLLKLLKWDEIGKLLD